MNHNEFWFIGEAVRMLTMLTNISIYRMLSDFLSCVNTFLFRGGKTRLSVGARHAEDSALLSSDKAGFCWYLSPSASWGFIADFAVHRFLSRSNQATNLGKKAIFRQPLTSNPVLHFCKLMSSISSLVKCHYTVTHTLAESELCCFSAGLEQQLIYQSSKWSSIGLFYLISFRIFEVILNFIFNEAVPLPLPITWGWPSIIIVTMTVLWHIIVHHGCN